MIFNGHTQESIDALDEATMNEISVMYADGLIGNKSVLVTLATLTAGVFNYLRSATAPPYTTRSILGSAYDYIYNEPAVSASDSLLTFISQANGFDESRFKGK
jgi:hypothetical protein